MILSKEREQERCRTGREDIDEVQRERTEDQGDEKRREKEGWREGSR